MEWLFLLMVLAGAGAAVYGLYRLSVKLFLWTIEPVTDWMKARDEAKRAEDLLREQNRDSAD